MQYRTLGKTGLNVSTLGFGCMRLPVIDNDMGKIDVNATETLFQQALNLGVNYVDTAYVYHQGKSESVMGDIIHKLGARSKVLLATKMPTWQITSRAEMEEIFETQCQRLRTDYIDLYLLHSLTKSSWANMQTLGALDFLAEMQAKGRIRHSGFSFHDDHDTFIDIIDAHSWEFCQIQYNYLDEEFQAGTDGLAYAANRGIGVVIMEPLRGGNLAQTPPADIQAIWDASPHRRSPADWALRWLLNKPEVAVILSGMNSPDQMAENARVCAEHLPNGLSTAEEQSIKEVATLFASRFPVACTGCRYCMPCPANVNIPAVFNIYNQYALFGNRQWCAGMYNFALSMSKERADQCVACGQCEEACPQNLPIIEKLKEAHAALEACGTP